MTKEQAYQQADTENLYATDQTNTDIIFRAMEIFAGAFSEWVDRKWFQTEKGGKGVVWTNVYTDTCNNDIYRTTPELIAEFEKIENK